MIARLLHGEPEGGSYERDQIDDRFDESSSGHAEDPQPQVLQALNTGDGVMPNGLTEAAVSWFEHGERSVPAARTVERLRPHLAALGITRLARQTGLDRIGVPCFSAIRPAGLTLSVSQGKGHDDDAAMASALMEAAEYAIAERPQCVVRRASAADLQRANEQIIVPLQLLPPDQPFDTDMPIGWVEGRAWPSGDRVWLPFDALSLGGEPADLPTISRSSNGLASGNVQSEALLHAICELVERDATSMWSLLEDPGRLATEFIGTAVDDAAVQRMCRQIEAAGLELRLFDQTTDLGVPCTMAVVSERTTGSARLFDMAAGYGCHPVGTRAISRAITEAVQSRLTNIAGGRDDFSPAEYAETTDASVAFLDQPAAHRRDPSMWLARDTALPKLLGGLAEQIGPHAQIAWAELGGAPYGISVVRAISVTLEDRETNDYWRPGPRAMKVLEQ
jgi:ribosomal protein S12 methylthiotransferase accessory factor